MLVLTRKFGESIRIGGTTVTVVRVVGGKVRLGIEAPPQVSISRGELCREAVESADSARLLRMADR